MDTSLLELARSALDDGRKADAQRLLTQLLHEEPSNEVAWIMMSDVVEEQERKQYCLERAMGLNPDSAEGRRLMSALGRPVGSSLGGLASLSSVGAASAPASHVESSSQQLDEARELIEGGREREGRLVLEQLLAREPRNAAAWGWLAAAAADPAKKQNYLNRALEIDPKNRMALRLQAQLNAPAGEGVLASQTPAPTRGYDFWGPGAWIAALWPSVGNYEAIVGGPSISLRRACVWVATASATGYLLADAGRIVTGQIAASSRVDGFLAFLRLPHSSGIDTVLTSGISLLCGWVVPVLLSTVGLLAAGGLAYLAAYVLRGAGSYTETVYAMASYLSPLMFAVLVLTVVPAGWLLAAPICIYGLVLNVVGARAVHRFGWGRAVATGVAPVVLSLAIVLLGLLVVAGTAGPTVAANVLNGLLGVVVPPTPAISPIPTSTPPALTLTPAPTPILKP